MASLSRLDEGVALAVRVRPTDGEAFYTAYVIGTYVNFDGVTYYALSAEPGGVGTTWMMEASRCRFLY